MLVSRGFLLSLHLSETLLDLPSSLILVFDSELKLFNFFIHHLILLVERVYKLCDIDSIITTLVHSLKNFIDHLVESDF